MPLIIREALNYTILAAIVWDTIVSLIILHEIVKIKIRVTQLEGMVLQGESD
jgi:hypothetical protein